MPGDLNLLARLLAFRDGRAQRCASHLQVALQQDAWVLCPIAMAGEDTTIHVVAYGRVGAAPRIRCVPDPRKRDDQFALFEALGAYLERYFEDCRRNGGFPQLWVSSGAVAGHLDTLADRLRYNSLNARVRRFGELLSYATGRFPIDGQQTLLTATAALRLHWATGQQPAEDEHLGTLLAWIDPPAGVTIQEAIAEAERVPMGVKTDPEFDARVLDPLVEAYDVATRGSGASPAAAANAARRIRRALEPVAMRVYDATQRAVILLQTSGFPALPDLVEMERREAAEFDNFMQARDDGRPLTLRDRPRAAAFGLSAREEARENVEAATVLGDRVARARARLTGRVVLGTVENPRRVRIGSRSFEDRFDLRSTQRILHVRLRDELLAVEDSRLKVLVEDVRRDTTSTVLSLRMLAGQRAVGLPAVGANLELVDGVPKWNDIWRVRGHLKKVLTSTPWTHRDDDPPVAMPRGGARPPDLLAAIDAFR